MVRAQRSEPRSCGLRPERSEGFSLDGQGAARPHLLKKEKSAQGWRSRAMGQSPEWAETLLQGLGEAQPTMARSEERGRAQVFG